MAFFIPALKQNSEGCSYNPQHSDKARPAELEALRDVIDTLRSVHDLYALLAQGGAIRERILSAWPDLIDEDEHSDWLDKLKPSALRRQL